METESQYMQTGNQLTPYPPILVIGKARLYLRAYFDVKTAVAKMIENFVEGGYGTRYDRWRIEQELEFFDAAGRELELVWDREKLQTMQVKRHEEHVLSRIRAMLHEVQPNIDDQRQKDPDFDDTPDRLSYNTNFEEFCREFAKYNADGFWHRVFGGD
jgi:hypothetical protein